MNISPFVRFFAKNHVNHKVAHFVLNFPTNSEREKVETPTRIRFFSLFFRAIDCVICGFSEVDIIIDRQVSEQQRECN
jgi:hypothetical protein